LKIKEENEKKKEEKKKKKKKEKKKILVRGTKYFKAGENLGLVIFPGCALSSFLYIEAGDKMQRYKVKK
jgi:hypothetical protein